MSKKILWAGLAAMLPFGGLMAVPEVPGDDEKFSLPADKPKNDPLGELSQDMIGVTRHLKDLETGDPTQMAQEEIVKKLDQMIETLNQK